MTTGNAWKVINEGDPLEHLGKQVEVRVENDDWEHVQCGTLALEDWDQDVPLLSVVYDGGKDCFYWYDEWRLL